jgi:glyoxylase-like metal-dependent hydrolase (beta-lactamase superfamily II)
MKIPLPAVRFPIRLPFLPNMPSPVLILPNLWLYPDTCNVYVLKDGPRALLMDFGGGDVLDQLPSLGIERVEWVLYTHHHREQCQGHARLAPLKTRVAVPHAEADLFTQPEVFYGQFSRYAVEGAPYARPPRAAMTVDRRLRDGDTFEWGPYRIMADHAPGHTPGMMIYRLHHEGRHLAFCGDLLRDDARLDTFYDSEWDYGYGGGMKALRTSVGQLRLLEPDLLLPSHGRAPLTNASEVLEAMERKLEAFLPLYLRDWDMERNLLQSRSASVPTEVNGLRRISPHLYSFTTASNGHNAYLLLSDSGHGLLVDAGIFLPDADSWLDQKLVELKAAFGLRAIDAVLVSHYHGDHLMQIPHLRSRYGVEVWTHEAVEEPLVHPDRHNLTCLHPNYGMPPDSVPVHRALKEGEVLRWEEFELEAFHLPGQTEFAAGYCGPIDGMKVCFTGDNLFASPHGSGHDAFIARNRGILEQGYLKCAETLLRLNPDLVLGGHGQEIPKPRRQIEQLHAWALRFRDALRGLSHTPDYEFLVDPYWVEVLPYKLSVSRGESVPAILSLTNHRAEDSRFDLQLQLPEGWTVEPRQLTAVVPPKSRQELEFTVRAPKHAEEGWYPLTVEVTFNGERLGEKFDSRLRVTGKPPSTEAS